MNLLRAASTISLFTLASRITGLAQNIVMSNLFGASAAFDAFTVAFRIPNLLRRLFGEGAFSQAFVPTLARARELEGDAAMAGLIDAVATILFHALVVTCIAGVVAAPLVVWLTASGLARFDAAVVMTRVMFPYIGLISLVSLSAGILNTWRRFAVPAATPVLLNLALIGAGWWLVPAFAQRGIEPVYALAVGVMIGGVLQLAVQVPALARIGRLPRIAAAPRAVAAAWRHPGLRTVLRQMGPALIGVSVAQISIVINTQIASHQGVGAVTWLFYADRLMEFPTAMLGVALGSVLIPQLTAAQARSDADAYSGLLDWGLRLALLLSLPCAAALLVFPEAMLATLFEHGAFTGADVVRTAAALRGYGVGLIGLIAIKILAPGFYARQDIRTPVTIAVIVLVITQALNVVLVPWLGPAGLALSVSLGALVNAAWLLVGLRRGGWYRPAPGWPRFALSVVTATLVMTALLAAAALLVPWLALSGQHLLRSAWMAACLAGAAAVYFAVLLLCGIRPAAFARRA